MQFFFSWLYNIDFFPFCFFIERHLTGEITQDWQELEDKDGDRKAKLQNLIKDIIPYLMNHNAEAEACDALMEIEQLDQLEQYVDENAFPRVCLYLVRLVITTNYVTPFFSF